MIVTWMILTALAVVAFVVVLVAYLVAILRTLEAIGGRPTSFLAKIRWGVRAIEQQTGMLPSEIRRLNEGASALLRGLQQVAGDLESASRALRRET
jgi:uncharacterized protein YoxC